MSLPRLGYKRHFGFCPGGTLTLSWMTHSGVSQLLRKGHGDEEPSRKEESPDNNNLRAILEVDLLGPANA